MKPGYTTSYQLLGRSQARIQTAYPFTARVFVKATKAHNWIPTERHGLVCTILQWSPDQRRWVVEPAEGLARELRLTLELMLRNPTNGGLIEALNDQDPRVREVAFRELTIRTSQDFGYWPDAPEGRRQAAIVQWREQWWATNKVSWTTDKVLDQASTRVLNGVLSRCQGRTMLTDAKLIIWSSMAMKWHPEHSRTDCCSRMTRIN